MQPLSDLQLQINTAFEQIRFAREPLHLYRPISYTLEMGGKRIRPLLTLLACDLFGGDLAKAMNPAIGVEIFHNFTLLHDDIMDNAPLRRGNATVHCKWDTNTAILSGDTMFVIAYEFVAKTDPGLLPEVLDLFNDTARKVCEGQQYDMNFETQEQVSIPDYMLMIRLKTAVLIACSLKLGALVARAPGNAASTLYDMGIELGLAFQLQDDYLDTFGDSSKFGKAIGGDIAANKKTFLLLKALERADHEKRNRLIRLFSGDPGDQAAKVSEVTRLFKDLRVDEAARAEIETHHGKALKILDSLDLRQGRDIMVGLMREMLGRER